MTIQEMIQRLSTYEKYHVRVTKLTLDALKKEIRSLCDQVSSTYYNELRQVLKSEDYSSCEVLKNYDLRTIRIIRKYFFSGGFSYVLPYAEDHKGERLYYIDEIDPKYYDSMKAFVTSKEIASNEKHLQDYRDDYKKRKELKVLKPKTKLNVKGVAYKNTLASIKYFKEMTLEEFIKFSRSNMMNYSIDGKYYNYYEMKYN